MVSALEQEQTEEALKNEKKVPHQMGHYRNHSAASAVSFCSIFSEPISEVNEKEYGKRLELQFAIFGGEFDEKMENNQQANYFRDELEEYGRDIRCLGAIGN